MSLEVFVKEKIPQIQFYKEVNSDVQEAFQVIHSLLVHSYFEYLFVDVAVNRALQVFEMALKLRYKELNDGKNWNKRKTLKSLIAWFSERKYFENDDQDFLDRIRHTRNYLVHPESHTFAGSVGFPWIGSIVDLINDLYEDRTLRVQRKNIEEQIVKDLRNIVSEGARLILPEVEILIYEVPVVLANNRTIPHEYFVGLLPIVNPGSHENPVILSLIDEQFSIEEGALTVPSPGLKHCRLTRVTDQEQISMVNSWKTRLQNNDPQVSKSHSILLYVLQQELIKLRRSFRRFHTQR